MRRSTPLWFSGMVAMALIVMLLVFSLGIVGLGDRGAQLQSAARQLGQATKQLRSAGTLTCVVQARGLRAQPYLIGYLDALHELLTQPISPAARRQAASQVPPAQLRREFALLASLNSNLGSYLAIVRRQPKHRSCGAPQ